MNDDIVNNELDFQRLVQAFAATRNRVLLSVLLLSLVFWVFQMSRSLVLPPTHTYKTRVDLIFPGIDELKYPNGTQFDIGDIISPVVMHEVHEINDLGVFVSLEDFQSSAAASPYSPERELILQKYATQARNLKQAEIDAQQAQLRSELEDAARGSVTISLSSSRFGKLPREVAEKVMLDIPRTWADHRVNNLGVSNHDRAMYSSKTIDASALATLDYLIAFEVLLARVRLVKRNLEQLRSLPNALVIRDDESGFNVPDLEQALEDLRDYQVVPLMNPIRALGIARDVEAVSLYFDNILRELKRSKSVMEQKRQNAIETYDHYLQYESAMTTGKTGSTSTGTMIPQFGAEFLDRIVEMTNAGDDIDYRQELNTLQLEISNELAVQNAEIGRIEETLAILKGGAIHDVSLKQHYEDSVVEEIPKILDNLRSYLDISNRLYLKLSKEQLGVGGSLYRLSDGGVDHATSNHIASWPNFRLNLILVLLLASVLVPGLMVLDVFRARESQNDQS